ncbi:MAG: diguanylate cyclase [Ilumatobacter sp.]
MTSEVPRWRRGTPVILLTLLLAVPRVIGSIGFVASDVGDAQDAALRLEDVEEDIDEALALIELRTVLLEEKNWELVVGGVGVLGVAPEFIDQMLGLDPNAELQAAKAASDLALSTIDDSQLLRATDQYRTATSLGISATLDAFENLERTVSGEVNRRLDALRSAAAGAPNGEAVLESVQRLRAAGEAQRSVASALISSFGAKFGDVPGSDAAPLNRLQLLEDVIGYDRAAAEFTRSSPGPEVSAEWIEVTTSPEYVAFFAEVDRVVEITVGQRSQSPNPLADLENSAATFAYAGVVVDDHQDLLRMVADETRSEAWALTDAAEDDVMSTMWMLVALLAATVAVMLLAAYVLVRPTRRLSAGAAMISLGDTTHRIPVRGTSELRDAAKALNSAAATLDLVEDQAHQMATGKFDASDVKQGAPGPLGESLQSAMEFLARSISEREQLRDELAHEASHDGLTGLPNRTAVLGRLDDAVARARRNGHQVAVMFLDLDGFKGVNDEYGHAVGDAVLRTVARRFQSVLRQGDVVGRLGGDEFLIIADPVRDVAESMRVAERLVEAAREPVDTDAGAVAVGASVGIALCDADGANPEAVLHSADVAVYQAKADDHRAIVVSSGIDTEMHVPN